MRQCPYEAREFRFKHGGNFRRYRAGRGRRPLSKCYALHAVFKINRGAVRGGLRHPRNRQLVEDVVSQYSRRFEINLLQVSIQSTHIHALVKGRGRHFYFAFLRVVAGQIAQRLMDRCDSTVAADVHPKKRRTFWKHRPFTRIVKGLRAQAIVRDYIQLNEAEARGHVFYQKDRLRGLTPEGRRRIWNLDEEAFPYGLGDDLPGP